MSDLPANLPEVTVTQDGKLVLTPDQLAKIIQSHLAMIEGLPDVDRAMLTKAASGNVQAAMIVYRRLGLLRGEAAATKPEVPDIPTHELQAELARRGLLKEAEVVASGEA